MDNFAKFMAASVFGAIQTLSAHAAPLNSYLIVGSSVNDTAVDVSNYELGNISALPGSAPSVSSPGLSPSLSPPPKYDGNIAITSTGGEVKLSNVDIYASRGIDCAGSYNQCTDNGGNLSNIQYDDAASGSGLRNISNGDGVNGGQDLSGITNQLDDFSLTIAGLSTTGSIATNDGKIESNTIVNLSSGLNVLDFSGLNGNDISVENANLIFQGAADAYAIVLVDDGVNFKTSQANLVVGNGGIGLSNVVIVSDDNSQDGNFDLSNTILNGIALWDLGDPKNNLSLDNVSGCTQLVGGDVDIQNVRLSRCGSNVATFVSAVPVPAAAWLFSSALLGLAGIKRKR